MRDPLGLVAAVLLTTLWCASIARAQSTDPFVLVIVGGDAQTTDLNQAFPQRLMVRLTDANGIPLQGAHIYFENEPCLSLLGTPCEFPGAPGHFESGSDNATVPTDATGLATSPTYYAGGSLGIDPRVNNLGAIGVSAYVVPNEAPYFFPVSVTLTHGVVFQLTEVALAQPVPISSVPLLGALGLLLAICGISRLQRNDTR